MIFQSVKQNFLDSEVTIFKDVSKKLRQMRICQMRSDAGTKRWPLVDGFYMGFTISDASWDSGSSCLYLTSLLMNEFFRSWGDEVETRSLNPPSLSPSVALQDWSTGRMDKVGWRTTELLADFRETLPEMSLKCRESNSPTPACLSAPSIRRSESTDYLSSRLIPGWILPER